MSSLVELLGLPEAEQARRIVAAWTRGYGEAATRIPADPRESNDRPEPGTAA